MARRSLGGRGWWVGPLCATGVVVAGRREGEREAGHLLLAFGL